MLVYDGRQVRQANPTGIDMFPEAREVLELIRPGLVFTPYSSLLSHMLRRGLLNADFS